VNTSSFETIAELALGIVGFSGIVLALRPRVHANPIERVRLVDLLVAGFGVVFMSFLPVLFDTLPFDQATAWRLASFAVAAWFAVGILTAVWRLRGRVPAPNVIGSLIGLGLSAALLGVSAGAWLDHAYSIYLAALLWGLFVAAMEFALLLLAGLDDVQE